MSGQREGEERCVRTEGGGGTVCQDRGRKGGVVCQDRGREERCVSVRTEGGRRGVSV